jgi:imidazolonepropionase-like amidohydrolase
VDVLFNDDRGAIKSAVELLLAGGFVLSAKHEFQLLKALQVGPSEFVFNIGLMHPAEASTRPQMFQDIMDLGNPAEKCSSVALWFTKSTVASSNSACSKNGCSKQRFGTAAELRAYIANMRIRFVLPVVILFVLFAGDMGRASDLALVGAKIYSSPTEPPIDNGSIIVHGGRILAVGPSATIKIPRAAKVIDCRGLVVTAGFWNSHVHIMMPGLLHAAKLSPEQIASQLEEMLTRWGFTTVFDIGSVLDNTTLIRRRIESGEVKGPRILTVGEPFWAKGGTPIYVRGFLEANHISIPEVESSAQAAERVRQQLLDGADGIKIFTGSVERDGILIMPLQLAKNIVAEAHRAGDPVFAHPSNPQGLQVALQSGVDILAHTTASGGPWSASLVESMKAAHMALIPTLTLWHVESKSESPEEFEKGMNTVVLPELRAYSEAGGQILFGTDVGYIEQFDTSEEFVWMSRAGMSFQQILASLTTDPAQRFGSSTHSGRIAKGMDADLVLLGEDPARDVTAFSRVRYTIRGGKVIYSQQ